MTAYLQIRPSSPADSAALVAILHDTFESTWRPQLSPAAVAAYQQGNRPAAYVAERGHLFHVATRAGAVAGLVDWQDDFVNALHVHSAHARTGAGTALMDLAEAEIARAGFPAARLETDTFNARSQAFYGARGYIEKGRYPDLEWNSNLTTILFEKVLGRA
ncbi:MAG: GNAT family N-acetyltransferase [Alphaproteobacteria bacterium]|nr:GNAT family N-acetyltransferase [Alphaproteobacteria bacterium]MBU2082957.1 GNAT family N-acetyltransferase [Alphaproteobacteria bacterium]MBU2143120.1 GNAT family N-acetyltransferase [Alphaproteobacteria bacterium]MBU2195832.1 GNAT family N-acetyltransferase [Alphaproteobacteria bacterium]